MTKVDFLVCYDIASKKRLPKIAKCLEKCAIRIQKSIFFYSQASQSDIASLIDEINEIIDDKEDDVRIYHIDIKNSIALESGINLEKANIII